jgi:hypothetical protein
MVDRAKSGKFLKSESNRRSDKFAILLPDHFDTINWETSPITAFLKREKYQIIIPQLYGENEFEVLKFNNKQQRLLTTYFTITELLTKGIMDSSSHIIAIGFGEGAYLIPELVNKRPFIHEFFMINSGLHSFRRELEYKMEEGSLSFIREPLIQRLGIRNYKQMKLALGQLAVAEGYTQSMGAKTDKDWNSYYNNPAFDEFHKLTTPGYVFISEEYPYVSLSGKQEIEYSIKNHIHSDRLQLIPLKGQGEFGQTSEADALVKKLAEFIR